MLEHLQQFLLREVLGSKDEKHDEIAMKIDTVYDICVYKNYDESSTREIHQVARCP